MELASGGLSGLVAASLPEVRPLADASVDDQVVWAMVDAAPDGTVLCDGDGRILFANRQAEVLFGYDRADLLGQPVEMLLPEALRRAHLGHRAGFAARPSVRAMGEGTRLLARRRDGSEFPVEIALSPVETGGQHLTLASIRDVSDRLAAEAYTRHVQQLLDGTRDGVYVMSPYDLRFEYVNQGAVSQSGYSEAELLTMTLIDLLVGAEAAEVQRWINPLLAGQAGQVRIEAVLRRRDGLEVPTEADVSFPQREDGQRRLVALVRDISDRRAAEADRQRIRDQLVEVLQAANVRVRRADPDGTITMAEGAPSGRFGSAHGMVGKNLLELAAAFPETRANFERALAGERFEATVSVPNGPILRDIFQPVMENGQMLELGMVTIDVTDLVTAQAEAALVRAAIDEAEEGVGIVDLTDGGPVLRFMNRRFADLYGRLEGGDLSRLVDESRRKELIETAAGLAAGEVFEFHQLLHHLDGSTLAVDAEFQRLDGDNQLLLVRWRDATARLAGEAERSDAETELALADERERVARDLHDTVIQELFAAGMSLEATTSRLKDPVAGARISTVVDQIDQAIRQLRASIFATGRPRSAGPRNISSAIQRLVLEANRMLPSPAALTVDPAVDDQRWRAAEEDLLACLRECLSNVARHAQASAVHVRVTVSPNDANDANDASGPSSSGTLTVVVEDDGVGPPPSERFGPGHGLENVTARALRHGGSFLLSAGSHRGTLATWTIHG